MRLKQKEIESIKEAAREVFGEDSKIRLFGSRTNDSLKGGDIDLLIHCSRTISSSEQYRLKIKFLVQLKKTIGDQKIDILIVGGQSHQMSFQRLP